MKSITLATLVFTVLLAPAFASADVFISFGFGPTANICGSYIVCIADSLIYIINSVLVPVLFAVAFIVFLYGVANAYILHPGDEAAVKKGHKLILWGLIGFAVMISVWGLVNVVVNTFDLWGYAPPLLPTSYR